MLVQNMQDIRCASTLVLIWFLDLLVVLLEMVCKLTNERYLP